MFSERSKDRCYNEFRERVKLIARQHSRGRGKFQRHAVADIDDVLSQRLLKKITK